MRDSGGQNRRDQTENGTPIDTADVMIAARALLQDAPVGTKNVDHFERVDSLEILTY